MLLHELILFSQISAADQLKKTGFEGDKKEIKNITILRLPYKDRLFTAPYLTTSIELFN